MTALDERPVASAVDVLVAELVAQGAPERGARLLVAADPALARDVVDGRVARPADAPPVGPDGEVWALPLPHPLEPDPSCRACGGAGHPDGPCGHCQN